MALLKTDFRAGTVAYFDYTVLLNSAEIDRNDDNLDRPGPFVCVEVKGDRSTWCAISKEERDERLPLEAAWRRNGNDEWRKDPQFLVDGLNTYIGPNEVFAKAAAKERSFAPFRRPFLTAAGVAAVIREINKQGGPLLATQGA